MATTLFANRTTNGTSATAAMAGGNYRAYVSPTGLQNGTEVVTFKSRPTGSGAVFQRCGEIFIGNQDSILLELPDANDVVAELTGAGPTTNLSVFLS